MVTIKRDPRRTRYSYDMDAVSFESGLACPEETLTQQQFAEEVDINTIVRRFGLTGQLPDNVSMPTYQDYEGVFDFQSAMNTMMEAERSFMLMPADIRARFDNDPQKLLEFCSDERNRDEAIKWGLVPSKEVLATPPDAAPAAAAPAASGAA